jgi:hypothetical protein
MKAVTQFILFVCLSAASFTKAQADVVADSAAGTNIRIAIYDGPKECGKADRVKMADKLKIHYTGTIDESSATGEAGSQFDSSRDRGVPLEVTIGVGDLIQGWDAGLLGLCQGAKVILVVPPEMGYGESGAGGIIPGGATLRFDVEIISSTPPPPSPNLFDELDVNQDGVLTEEEIHAHFKKEGPDATMPPDLMSNEDTNGDGVVTREEFGGPRMPWEMCLEMLHHNRELNLLGLSVRWICQRPRDPEDLEEEQVSDNNNKENEEL